MHLAPLGDSAVVIELGNVIKETTLARVRALAAALTRDPPAGVVDVVPAFTTVTVFYDPGRTGDYASLCKDLQARARNSRPSKQNGVLTITIPVCYGGALGPDLAEVAHISKQSEEEVVRLHAEPLYAVHAIGFTPGFPYLGGLPEKLHVPRRATPRTVVPAGSVGIGGAQTGIYPRESPGGWNIIGRTPLVLFQSDRPEPALLRVGDCVQFKPISEEEFAAWK